MTAIMDTTATTDRKQAHYITGEAVPDFRNPQKDTIMTIMTSMAKSKKPVPYGDVPAGKGPMGKGKGKGKGGKC
jgi:hypothetical protein